MTRLLSIKRVAARCDIHEKTIRRWWAEGIFPAPVYLPNGLPRWHACIVDMWLSSRPSVEPVKENPEGQGGTGRDREGQIPAAKGKPEKRD